MIRINGNDLILLGLCFGIAGTLLLAKGYIFQSPGAIQDESAAYYGANPFAIRNKIIQRYEGISGWLLVLPAALLQLAGIFINLRYPDSDPLLAGSMPNLFFLVLFSAVLFWGTNIAAGGAAKSNYMPQLKAMQMEAMNQAESVFKNDGLYREDIGIRVEIERETRDARLRQMKQRLGTWERLFQRPRKSHETDVEYLERLKIYLDSQ